MKKTYLISGSILSAMTLVIFLIITINEDISVRIASSLVFPVIVFVFSLLCLPISRKILKKGDGIYKRLRKVIYYTVLPIISFVVFFVIAMIMYYLEDLIPSTSEFSTELGRAILFIFLLVCVFLFIVVPVIQTYVVMILRLFIKEDNQKNNIKKEESHS